MRLIFRRRRAQFVLLAALVMSLMILSVAISVYQASSEYQQLAYDQTTEIIQNIGGDYGRALVNILANLTQSYYVLAEMTTPRYMASQLFSSWTLAAARAYAAQGVQLGFSTPSSELLQPAGSFYGYNTSDEYVGNLTKLYWYAPQSLSAIYATYNANVTGLGFYNWHEEEEYLLNMTMDVSQADFKNQTKTVINGVSYPVLNVTIGKEGGAPVEDLSASNFWVEYFDVGTDSWQNANLTVENLGGGNYSLLLSSYNGQRIPNPYWQYLLVTVKDNRGIMVEGYSYTYVDYTIQENAFSSSYNLAKPNETYALELLYNGSMMWYNSILNSSVSTVPIPLPPVKQFRVNSTVTGPSDVVHLSNNTIPSQVEVWQSDLVTPSPNFADWQLRFNESEKLVFLVNFAAAGVHQQTVRVYWLADGDAAPPQFLIGIIPSSGFVDISNAAYTLRLLNNVSMSLNIDYSLSMIFDGYHIESEFNAIGWIPSANWEPHMLPGGDWNDSTPQSFIIAGPVRAVAFRSTNNDTLFGFSNGNPTETFLTPGPFYHIDMLLIPYDTSYVQVYETYNWTKSYSDGLMANLITLIAGVSDESDMAQRPTNWAYQAANGGINSGKYSGSPGVISTNTSAAAFGVWFSEYNTYIGEAIIGGSTFVHALTQLKDDSLQPAYMIWNSGDGARDALWASQQWWNWGSSSQFTITPQVITYTAAIWTYNGYSTSSSANLANLPPNLYYGMFEAPTYPNIVNATSGY